VIPQAHGGGVPETLSVVIPLALVVVLLRYGARKAPPDPDNDPDEPNADGPGTPH
jgi:hypothetical protein